MKSIKEYKNHYEKAENIHDLLEKNSFKEEMQFFKYLDKAKELGETIVIFGDYDADGITGSAVIANVFNFLNIKYYLYTPNRLKSEGYGLNPKSIVRMFDELKKKQIENYSVLTVDNGITANEAVKMLKEQNTFVVVTDHHEPNEILPEADLIINTKLEDKDGFDFNISGSNTVYCLLYRYIYHYLKIKSKKINRLMRDLLSVTAISTIADVIPLDNKLSLSIVDAGLSILGRKDNRFKFLGNLVLSDFDKMLNSRKSNTNDVIDFDIQAEDIGYKIAPAINSIGRMKGNVLKAIKSLISEDEGFDRYSHLRFNFLEEINEARKDLVSSLEDKEHYVMKNIIYDIFEIKENISGIFASKILGNNNIKAAVIFLKNGELLSGSLRAKEGVDMFSLLKHIESKTDILISYGGHKSAAGVTIKEKDLDDFVNMIDTNILDFYEELEECEVYLAEDIEDFSQDVIAEILSGEPFSSNGAKREFPKIVIKDLHWFFPEKYEIKLSAKGNFYLVLKKYKIDNAEYDVMVFGIDPTHVDSGLFKPATEAIVTSIKKDKIVINLLK